MGRDMVKSIQPLISKNNVNCNSNIYVVNFLLRLTCLGPAAADIVSLTIGVVVGDIEKLTLSSYQ